MAISLTDAAANRVRSYLDKRNDSIGLRLGVNSTGCSGYSYVINYAEENVLERVLEITDGEKLPVVYDGVGKDTFELSLSCLRPRGLMVSFGNASGSPAPLDLQQLAANGSLYITRPTMLSYTATEEELRQSSADVFERILSGDIRVEINQRYPLADVQQAHHDLQSRKTTGSTVLLP